MAYIGNPLNYVTYILNMGTGLLNLVLGYGNDVRNIPGDAVDDNLTFVMVCDCGSDNKDNVPYVKNSLNFFNKIIEQRAANEVRFIERGKKSYNDFKEKGHFFSYNGLIDVLVFSHTDMDHINKFERLYKQNCKVYFYDWESVCEYTPSESGSCQGVMFNMNWIPKVYPNVYDIEFKYSFINNTERSSLCFDYGYNTKFFIAENKDKSKKIECCFSHKISKIDDHDFSIEYGYNYKLISNINNSFVNLDVKYHITFDKFRIGSLKFTFSNSDFGDFLKLYANTDFSDEQFHLYLEKSKYKNHKSRFYDMAFVFDTKVYEDINDVCGIIIYITDFLKFFIETMKIQNIFSKLKVESSDINLISELYDVVTIYEDNSIEIAKAFIPDESIYDQITYEEIEKTIEGIYSNRQPEYIITYDSLYKNDFQKNIIYDIPTTICVHDYYKPKYISNGVYFDTGKNFMVNCVAMYDLPYETKKGINRAIEIYLVPAVIDEGNVLLDPAIHDAGGGTNQNRYSYIVRILYNNGVSVLLPGDATVHNLLLCIDSDFGINSTVLCAPHHGSSTTSKGRINSTDYYQILNKYLGIVKAKFHIICAGYDNTDGNPGNYYIAEIIKTKTETFREHLVQCYLENDVTPTFNKDVNFDFADDHKVPITNKDGSTPAQKRRRYQWKYKQNIFNTYSEQTSSDTIFTPIYNGDKLYNLGNFIFDKLYFNYFRIEADKFYVCDAVPPDGNLNDPTREYFITIPSDSDNEAQRDFAVEKPPAPRPRKPFKFEHNGASLWK